MRNEFERYAAEWGIPVVIAFFAVAVRMLFSADRMTLLGVLRGVMVGLFVGVMVNLYLVGNTSFIEGEKGAIIGVAAILAEDLVVAVLTFGRKIRENPGDLIDAFLKVRK